MEGHGVYYWTDEECRYEGDWVNDNREGHGIEYYADGSRFNGNWVNDEKEGRGVLYNKGGTLKSKLEWKGGHL